MKKLYCDRCGKYLGEMEKGRIKTGTVMICNQCNARLKIAEASMETKKGPTPMPDFFKDIFEGKK